MKLKIIKFGGSSIADAKRIRNITELVKIRSKKSNLAIVVSAIGGVTNILNSIAEKSIKGISFEKDFYELISKHVEIINNLFPKNKKKVQGDFDSYVVLLKSQIDNVEAMVSNRSEYFDTILCFGEIFSSSIISRYFSNCGIPSEQLDSRDVILTNDNFGQAFVHYQKTFNQIRNYLKTKNKIQIITGFIGANSDGKTTTLGRNGSDYTASIFGAALNASAIEIWTDVDGILSANPKIVKAAEPIPHMTYEEAMELAHAGASVIFPPSMVPALYKNIPIYIKNTFNPNFSGSKINNHRSLDNNSVIGISSLSNISLVLLQGAGLVSVKGTIGRIFSSLAGENINIILISMAFSEHSVCFAIKPKYDDLSIRALRAEFKNEIARQQIDKIKLEKNLSLVAVVGEGMRQNPGISGRVFSTLGLHKISIIAIAQGSSERNISFIVKKRDANDTLNILHREFFQKKEQKTHIYLVGIGDIGLELLQIIRKLKTKNFTVSGIANSKKMLLGKIDLKKAHIDILSSSNNFNFKTFTDKKNIVSKNNIFVDCTASKSIAESYPEIIKKGFSIVTANKIANTLDYNYYLQIRALANENKSKFLYETNVGAGLPIISTLQGLIFSGDKILEIEGVLSGTLSYLFNNFSAKTPFSKLVKGAKEKGFTEPDPRDDLSGTDVGRKLLILCREVGERMEIDDIKIQSLLPEKSDSISSIDEFYRHLSKIDAKMKRLILNAKKRNEKLRYIAKYKDGKGIVSLQSVKKDHPFFALKGTENIISIKTSRYYKQPLVIKGPGAGASVTASGVLNDIQNCIKI